MHKKEKWFSAVILGIVVLLLGSAPESRAGQFSAASHPLTFIVEEAAWLQVDDDGEIEFVLGIDPEGRFDFRMHRTEVDVHYASIVPENKRRSLTAHLDGPLPEGIILRAQASITRGQPGQAGTPVLETVLSPQDSVLIRDIGTVDGARANVTYRVSIDPGANLLTVGQTSTTVWFTLTAAQ